MTDIVLSFDTEDYVNPAGADGIMDMATYLQGWTMRLPKGTKRKIF